MSEAFFAADDQPTSDELRTGDPTVDGVLDRLADLDAAEVDEHVAVFEHAHEQLRRALDTAPGS